MTALNPSLAADSRALGKNNVRMGQLGATGTVNSPLSGNFVAGKNENYPFYGLSPVFTIATPVLNDWSLKPSGLGVGDGFRLIFLSSTKRNASSSSIGDLQHLDPRPEPQPAMTDIQAYSDGFTVVGCTASRRCPRQQDQHRQRESPSTG